MKTATEVLSGHALAKRVLNNLQPLLKEAGNELKANATKGKLRKTGSVPLAERDWYDYDVFSNLTPIFSAIERMEQGREFIRIFPEPWKSETRGVSQHSWIEYHYAYYLVSLVSLADITLGLTNSVFRLGIRPRDCKADLIIKNSWVEKTPVAKALEKVGKFVNPHRMPRNLYVHRGAIPKIATVMKSETLDSLATFSFLQTVGKPVISQEILKTAYNRELGGICARLDIETKQLCDSISALFDTLFPIYERNANVLRGSPGKQSGVKHL